MYTCMRQCIHVWDNVYVYEIMYMCMRQCICVWDNVTCMR